MSTQGILISGNNNSNMTATNSDVSKVSRGRASSVVPALNLGYGQENRIAPEQSMSHRVKSPSSKLKSQIISPRFSITKIEPILTSNKKSNTVNISSSTSPRDVPILSRRESSNNLKSLFKPSLTNNRNSSIVSNPISGGTLKNSGSTSAGGQSITIVENINTNNTCRGASTNHNGANLRTSSQTMSRTGASSTTTINKAIIRSNSSFNNNSFKTGSKISNNQAPRSPPPLSQDQKKYATTSNISVDAGDLPSPSLTRSSSRDNMKVPEFPSQPDNPEKQFTRGTTTDKLAYQIWLKERMKYDKWESSKKLFQSKLAEGNISACQRIVDRLNPELEELTKSIREDECRRVFPEEPVKPPEFCPSNVKDAKVWYQQKVVYEAWENAFNLFQDSMAKGDSIACKKLVDAIQMTIYNPQYKSELPVSQPNSSRRESTSYTAQLSCSKQDQAVVKFAVADIPITNNNNNPTNGLPKSRPKLQPPASWTKPRVRENQDEKKMNTGKSNSDSSMDVTPEQIKVEERSTEDKKNQIENENEVYEWIQPASGSTSSDLIEAIDSVLAELSSNTFYYNPSHISS